MRTLFRNSARGLSMLAFVCLVALALNGIVGTGTRLAQAQSVDFSSAWRPFQPMVGANVHAQLATVVQAATTSAANVTLPVGDGGNNQIEIFNGSTGVAQCNFGDGGNVTAVTAGTGFPVGAGARRVITVLPFQTGASCLSSVAGNIYFTRGNGAN